MDIETLGYEEPDDLDPTIFRRHVNWFAIFDLATYLQPTQGGKILDQFDVARGNRGGKRLKYQIRILVLIFLVVLDNLLERLEIAAAKPSCICGLLPSHTV